MTTPNAKDVERANRWFGRKWCELLERDLVQQFAEVRADERADAQAENAELRAALEQIVKSYGWTLAGAIAKRALGGGK